MLNFFLMMQDISLQFSIQSEVGESRPLKVGLINDSYVVPASRPGAPSVSWSPINLPSPNFHCPEFFGRIVLEK